jgi:hypothetical protein
MIPTADTLIAAFAAPDSEVPPTFIVQMDSPRKYSIELAGAPDYFGTMYETDRDQDRFRQFSTAQGNSTLKIKPVAATTPKQPPVGASQPFWSDTWSPEPAVWKSFKSRHDRVYYRVVADGLHSIPEVMEPWPGERTGRKRGNFVFSFGQHRASFDAYASASVAPLGSLSGLSVLGNQLVEAETKQPVVLRGMNVSGLQYRRRDYSDNRLGASTKVCDDPLPRKPPPTPRGGVTEGRWPAAAGINSILFDWVKRMGANAVRLTLNQEWALESPGRESNQLRGLDYLADLDQVIGWANSCGLYVIVALHSLFLSKRTKSPKPGKPPERTANATPYNAPMPDPLSGVLWSLLAARYKHHPGVVLDLCNEPHKAKPNDTASSDDQPYRSAAADRPLPDADEEAFWIEEWQNWARYGHRIVRGGAVSEFGLPPAGARSPLKDNAPLLVAGFGGGDWSASVKQRPEGSSRTAWPIKASGTQSSALPLPDVVYKVHWYFNKGLTDEIGWRIAINAGADAKAKPWPYPVFLGEWGAETEEAVTGENSASTNADTEYYKNFQKTRPKLPESGLSGWAAKLVSFLEGQAAWYSRNQWKGMCGWTAWSMGDAPHIAAKAKPSTCNGPYLPGRSSIDFKPTDYGSVVLNALYPVLTVDVSARPLRMVAGDSARSTQVLRAAVKNKNGDPLCGYDIVFEIVEGTDSPPITLTKDVDEFARNSTSSITVSAKTEGRCVVQVSVTTPSRPQVLQLKERFEVVVSTKK